MENHEDKLKSSNKVDEDFSESKVEENREKKIEKQIKELEETNQNYFKEKREVIGPDKAWFDREINFNEVLINDLKMSLNH
jgi:hypothetical protein